MVNPFIQTLSGGEAFNVILASRSISEIIQICLSGKNSPLYYIVVHFITFFAGSEEQTLRIFSFILFFLTCVMVFLIASHVWSKKTGLYASVLTFFNPFLLPNSTLVNTYIFSMFLTFVSIFFFIKRKRLPFCVSTVLALYSNIFVLFVFIPIILFALKNFFFEDKKIAIKWFKFIVISFFLYLPWLFLRVRELVFTKPTEVLDISLLRNILLEFVSGKNTAGGVNPSVYVIIILLLIRNWLNKIEKSLFFLSVFFVPIFLYWYVSQRYQLPINNNHLLFTIPAISLILASNKRVPASNIVIGVLLIFYIFSNFKLFSLINSETHQVILPYIKEFSVNNPVFLSIQNTELYWMNKFYKLDTPIYNPSNIDLHFENESPLVYDGLTKIPDELIRFALIAKKFEGEPIVPGYIPDSAAEVKDVNIIWYTKI